MVVLGQKLNDLNTDRAYSGGSGTYTSALAAAGASSPSANTVNSETWNGSAWTEVANVSTSRSRLAAFGTQGLSVASGGFTQPNTIQSSTEEFTSPLTSTVTFTVS